MEKSMPVPICPDREPHNSVLYGATGPDFDKWCELLVAAVGPAFREGMILLDYGCGNGRFCNYISSKLYCFLYYGLEPKTTWGELAIGEANAHYGHDKRVRLGFTGTPIEYREALVQSDTILLSGVFTHLAIEDFERIMDSFRGIFERGGTCVFSVFLADAYSLDGSGAYHKADCYNHAYYTRKQLEHYCLARDLSLEEAGTFLAQGSNLHYVFRCRKKEPG